MADVGPEFAENLALWRVPTPKIEAVFLTHFYSDHIGELGELNMQGWAQGRHVPLKVYGPVGLDQVVGGFNPACSFDRQCRNAQHSHSQGLLRLEAAIMAPNPADFVKPGEVPSGRTGVGYDKDGVTVTAIETDHRPVSPPFPNASAKRVARS